MGRIRLLLACRGKGAVLIPTLPSVHFRDTPLGKGSLLRFLVSTLFNLVPSQVALRQGFIRLPRRPPRTHPTVKRHPAPVQQNTYTTVGTRS